MAPSATPFLAARPGGPGDAIILGAPLDLTESCRSGTRAAPAVIRHASDTIESYSPALDRDLEDLALADWGDLDLAGLDMEAALRRIESRYHEALGQGFALLLGGEHTVALAGFRAARRLHPEAMLLQLDAHLDFRESFLGDRVCHATWAFLAGEEFGFDSIVQLGIRSGARDEFQRARRATLYTGADLHLPRRVRTALAERPVYLSVDIDVLDPGAAPGTGCPEPGGVLFRELLQCLYELRDLRVVGADICEVLPEVDPAQVTAIAAAKLARELLLLFAR